MIQYIQVETDEKGEIVRLGFVDSMTSAYSTIKKLLSETSGLPAGASTKDHISKIKEAAAIDCTNCTSAHLEVKQKLAAESGLHFLRPVEEHLMAIKSKARLVGLDSGRKYTTDILAKHSGLDPINDVGDHIAAIKLKAYDEGYDDGRRDMRTDIQERMEQFEEAIKGERKAK